VSESAASSGSGAPSDRRPRADAVRNRARVLDVAYETFAADGLSVPIDEIARRAGVGAGTVYRHFPTKDALLGALAEELFAKLAAHAREMLELDDPWEAFERTMWFSGEKTAGDRAFAEILAASRDSLPVDCPGKKELTGTVDTIMKRAIKAGKMRPDVVIDDIPLLMCGIGSASAMPHPNPEAWRRHLGIVLDGMRAEAASLPLRS
jgi:AcrR family transcriptional regulator